MDEHLHQYRETGGGGGGGQQPGGGGEGGGGGLLRHGFEITIARNSLHSIMFKRS